MTSQTAVFAVPATAGLAEVAADALTAVAQACGIRAEHSPGRAGSRLITLHGPLGREAAEEVLPVLLAQALREATTAAREAVHRGRASADHLRTYRTAYLAAWGTAVAGLIDRSPEGPVAPPATPAAKAAAAADELGAVLEHARDLRDRAHGGPLPAALRLREIWPERDGYYSLEAFVRNDGPGAAARLAMITPILPVLRAAIEHVDDTAGRGGVHLRLTGRRYSLAAAAGLLPALLAHAEPAAAAHAEPAAYLASFARAAAARLTAALASLYGAARDRHQAETGAGAQDADRVPAAVFEQAAAHFGAEPPAPAAPAFTAAPAVETQPHTRSVIAVHGGPAHTSALASALTVLIEAYGVRVEKVEDRPRGGVRHLTVSGPLRLVHAARTDAPAWQDAMNAALAAARPGRTPRRATEGAKTFVSDSTRQAARAAYLAAWALAAAARLRATLAGGPGDPGEDPAAEACAAAPGELFAAAAARIRAALGQGSDPDRALELVVCPGGVRARDRVEVLELLAGPLGVSVTRLGTVAADMERDADDSPAVGWDLRRERVRLDGPSALLEHLPALAAAVLAHLEPAAALAVNAQRTLDAGPNGRIMRRLAVERFVVESARVLARRLRRAVDPNVGAAAPSDTDGAEQAADRAADLLAPAAAAVHAADQRRMEPSRPGRARRVVIVPCGARKLDRPAEAGQLYTGLLVLSCSVLLML